MLRWFKSNHQALTAIGAMVVGLAALYVAWDQARVMRAQQHGAVYPALQMDGFVTYQNGRQSVGLRVTNSGVGPAIIEDVVLLRDEEPSEEFRSVIDLAPEGSDLSWTTMIGRVLAAGDAVEPIEMSWSADGPYQPEMTPIADEWTHWDISICYCSVFDRCWRSATTGVGLRPERVPHCERPDYDIFEDLGRDADRLSNPLETDE
ncbi:hypothetical protein V0U79_13295 [Hyphobacterium sp. HN65]|uniref:Uncharacterized protein n=1 Tax=Hyphobacterium lacteum TaxID=3116575 RepID=A0ABU7LTU3_9PROT|nr:hypothetical protein [Hyphobacterium sp. HN65]MEE2527336.1 hypothetical protein [Hyphobacterium sp. HN65]